MKNKELFVIDDKMFDINLAKYTMDNNGNIIKTNNVLTVEPYKKLFLSNIDDIYYSYDARTDTWSLQDTDTNACELKMTFNGKYHRIDQCINQYKSYKILYKITLNQLNELL